MFLIDILLGSMQSFTIMPLNLLAGKLYIMDLAWPVRICLLSLGERTLMKNIQIWEIQTNELVD